MLKILHQYVNQELSDVQAGLRKDRKNRDQVANIHWIIEKAREFQKNIYFCFVDHIPGGQGWSPETHLSQVQVRGGR